MRIFVIGSRGSALARWQAEHIAGRLQAGGIPTRIEIIRTTGDHLQTASLAQVGGKGLFTKEIEDALLNREIDLAVHSLKDLPTEIPPGLTLAAIPERENPFDVMVGASLPDLPMGARIGTSSGRRGAQLRYLRRDVEIHPIRGNVDTRLRKQKTGEFDAILLAFAGLRRLGLEREVSQVFSSDQMCPAPGQGALAVQTRIEENAAEIRRILDHLPTRTAVEVERAVLAGLGGGCQLPVGAYATLTGNVLRVSAVVVSPDGSRLLRESISAGNADPVELGAQVAQTLLRRGAADLLAAAVPVE